MKVIGVSGPIGAGKSGVIAAICSDARLAHDLGGAVLAVDELLNDFLAAIQHLNLIFAHQPLGEWACGEHVVNQLLAIMRKSRA